MRAAAGLYLLGPIHRPCNRRFKVQYVGPAQVRTGLARIKGQQRCLVRMLSVHSSPGSLTTPGASGSIRGISHRAKTPRVRAEVPRATSATLKQRVNEKQVPVEAVKDVLPWAHRIRESDGYLDALSEATHEVGKQSVHRYIAAQPP